MTRGIEYLHKVSITICRYQGLNERYVDLRGRYVQVFSGYMNTYLQISAHTYCCICHYLPVFLLKYLHIAADTYCCICHYLPLFFQLYLQIAADTYCCICHYLSVFLQKFLIIPTYVLIPIRLYFVRNTYTLLQIHAGMLFVFLFQINADIRPRPCHRRQRQRFLRRPRQRPLQAPPQPQATDRRIPARHSIEKQRRRFHWI